MAKQSLSIVIPALEEELGIGATIDELPVKELNRRGFETEIIVVDGNSKDNTVGVAKAKGARVIIEDRPGYGRAFKTGFENANGTFIATLDADATYPADKIPELLQYLIENNLDLVSTNRFADLERGAMSFSHKFGNKLLTFVARTIYSVKIKDSQSGMWVFRRKLLNTVGVTSDSMGFSQEFKIRSFQNASCRELPISYKCRIGQNKLNTIRDGYSNFKELVGLIRHMDIGPLIPAPQLIAPVELIPVVERSRTLSKTD